MNQKDREVAREQYYRLEERFLELTQYIPLVADVEETRYEIVSPRAAEFGIDCGTWIDTLMRDLVFDERCNSAPGVENLRQAISGDGRVQINLLRDVLEPLLRFSAAAFRLRGFTESSVVPFRAWADGRPLDWYQVYSAQKHNRLKLAQEFTMGHALHSFAGLTVLVPILRQVGEMYQPRSSRVFDQVLI